MNDNIQSKKNNNDSKKIKEIYDVGIVDFLLFSYALLSCSNNGKVNYVAYQTLENWSCLGFKKIKSFIDRFDGKLFDVSFFVNKYNKKSIKTIHLRRQFFDLLGTHPNRKRLFMDFLKKSIHLTRKCKLSRLILFILARHQKLSGETTLLSVKRIMGFVSGGALQEIEDSKLEENYFRFANVDFNAGTERKVQEALLRLLKLTLVDREKLDGVFVFSLNLKKFPPDTDPVPRTKVLDIQRISVYGMNRFEKKLKNFKEQNKARKKNMTYAKYFIIVEKIMKCFKNFDFKEAWNLFDKNSKFIQAVGKKRIIFLLCKNLCEMVYLRVWELSETERIKRNSFFTSNAGKYKRELLAWDKKSNKYTEGNKIKTRSILYKEIWSYYRTNSIKEIFIFGFVFKNFISNLEEELIKYNFSYCGTRWSAIDWRNFVDINIRKRSVAREYLLDKLTRYAPTIDFDVSYMKKQQEKFDAINAKYFRVLIAPLKWPGRYFCGYDRLDKRLQKDLLKEAKELFYEEFGSKNPLQYVNNLKEEVKSYGKIYKEFNEKVDSFYNDWNKLVFNTFDEGLDLSYIKDELEKNEIKKVVASMRLECCAVLNKEVYLENAYAPYDYVLEKIKGTNQHIRKSVAKKEENEFEDDFDGEVDFERKYVLRELLLAEIEGTNESIEKPITEKCSNTIIEVIREEDDFEYMFEDI